MKAALDLLFPAILNMSMAAIPVILAVLLARLVLKRAPRIFSYVLWAVVLFRLLCPVSLTSSFSLLGALDAPVAFSGSGYVTSVEYIPSAQEPTTAPFPVTPEVNGTAEVMPAPEAPPAEEDAAPLSAMDVLPWVWLAGLLVLLIYSAISLLRLHRRLVGAVQLRGNIYLSDGAETSFVTGVIRPRIYLPSSMAEEEQTYILAHERHHIRRGDPLWKLLAFLALALHWFNPLVWLSFVLAARDMEMSCDEAVVRKLGTGIQADYAQSLLKLAAGHRLVTAPLAFGEGDTRSRITNVLNWKRPRTWVVLLSSVACVALVAACASNPAQKQVGQYATFEDYVAQQAEGHPETLELPAWDEVSDEVESVVFPVLEVRVDGLELAGKQSDLDPGGILYVWRYALASKLDLNGYDSEDVGWVGGSYTDEEGFHHGSGQRIAVTRSYPDGSLDVLEDTLDIDGTGFQAYNNSWDDALYDWYVRENGLEAQLPLLAQNWQHLMDYPEEAYMGAYPVYRIDGDGWYFYAPDSAWTHSEGFWEDCWESAYGTGSFLIVDSFTHSIEAEQAVCKKQGCTPMEGSFRDGNWYIWDTPRSPEGVGRYYFFEKPDGGCWRVWIHWDPETIDSHWSPYPKLEPQVLELMARSFMTDGRFHRPTAIGTALDSLRLAWDWEQLPAIIPEVQGASTAVPPFQPSRLAANSQSLYETIPADIVAPFRLTWPAADQSLDFVPSETAGEVIVQYTGQSVYGEVVQTGAMMDPELYVWLTAAQQSSDVRQADVDGDGFLEAWFNDPTLHLYDFYDGRLQKPKLPTQDAAFVAGDPKAPLLSVNHRYHLYGEKHGKTHLFSCMDGKFTDLGPWDDAEADLQNSAEVIYRDQPLETAPAPMTFAQWGEWIYSQGKQDEDIWPCRAYLMDDQTMTAVYLQELVGTPHQEQYQLVLRFPDDTTALLPLPGRDMFHPALPEEWGTVGNRFLYQMTVPQDAVLERALETHHYQVDLDQKTVTLLVER